jgi:hypothetical protein
MDGLPSLSLISAAILGVLWAIGKAGDLGMRMHRDTDSWSAQ